MNKRNMDTEVDQRALAVEAVDAGSWSGPQPTMIRLSEVEVYPGWSVVLTVDEARKLATFLDHTADEASLLNHLADADA